MTVDDHNIVGASASKPGEHSPEAQAHYDAARRRVSDLMDALADAVEKAKQERRKATS